MLAERGEAEKRTEKTPSEARRKRSDESDESDERKKCRRSEACPDGDLDGGRKATDERSVVFFASFVSFVDQNLPSAARPVPTRPRRRAKTLSASLRSAGFLSSLASLASLFSASLRSAEIGRAADAAQARASPASLTDGEDAVGTSRASARRTSSPVVGIFRRLASLGVFPVAFFSSLSSCVIFCVFPHRAHRAHCSHRAHCPRLPPRKAYAAAGDRSCSSCPLAVKGIWNFFHHSNGK